MTNDVLELAKVLFEARIDEVMRQQGLRRLPHDSWEKVDEDERGQCIAQARASLAHVSGASAHWTCMDCGATHRINEPCKQLPSDIDDAEMREIQERVDAATPGPWWSDTYNVAWSGKGDDCKKICTIPDHPKDDVFDLPAEALARSEWYRESANNLEFIAHARTDIPKLLAALRSRSRISADDQAILDKLASDGLPKDVEAHNWVHDNVLNICQTLKRIATSRATPGVDVAGVLEVADWLDGKAPHIELCHDAAQCICNARAAAKLRNAVGGGKSE